MTKPLNGPNVLLMGPAGTGKTRSIGTLADTGLEVFVVFLEAGLESLIGYYTDQGKPIPPNLHWHVLEGPKRDFKTMAANALKVNTLDQKTLANMNDPNRSQHNTFIKLVEVMGNFKDDRTGKEFGPVDTWGPDRAVCIDGLTGVCAAAMSMVTGGKPMRSQPDWGIAQDQVETFLRMCCDQCSSWFVLLSHVDRETDLVSGGIKLMPTSLGKALPPKIAPMFSDVILTVREGTTWSWDTANSQADVKARNLPWKAGQKPDFRTIYESWQRRSAAATTPEPAAGGTQG